MLFGVIIIQKKCHIEVFDWSLSMRTVQVMVVIPPTRREVTSSHSFLAWRTASSNFCHAASAWNSLHVTTWLQHFWWF